MATVRIRPRGRGAPSLPQWAALGVAALIILALTFTLGMLVGRQWARQTQPAVAAESARKAPASPRRGGPTETGTERGPRLQEKLTFYQTLTAPLGAVPTQTKGDATPGAGAPPKARANGERTPPRGTEPVPPRATGAETQAKARLASVETRAEWTVQVGVFKSPQQAAGVKRQLAEKGFEAEVAPMTGDDGHLRYRVRVGTFRSKEDAVRTAERVRSDRSLPTFVTVR
jgi:cell division protein FtsN